MNKATALLYYKFQCLPLLPPTEILSAYEALKIEANDCNEAAFSPFLKYYEQQWLTKVINNDLYLHLTTCLTIENTILGRTRLDKCMEFRHKDHMCCRGIERPNRQGIAWQITFFYTCGVHKEN